MVCRLLESIPRWWVSRERRFRGGSRFPEAMAKEAEEDAIPLVAPQSAGRPYDLLQSNR